MLAHLACHIGRLLQPFGGRSRVPPARRCPVNGDVRVRTPVAVTARDERLAIPIVLLAFRRAGDSTRIRHRRQYRVVAPRNSGNSGVVGRKQFRAGDLTSRGAQRFEVLSRGDTQSVDPTTVRSPN